MPTLADYNNLSTPVSNEPESVNWWQNRPKYMVSLLKAYFGYAATQENDFGYGWLPKADVAKANMMEITPICTSTTEWRGAR